MPIKTELIWDGKYDSEGRRVAPLRVALPFQTVETVNESSIDRQFNLFQAASKAKPWRNRLIWGDKKFVLPSLLPEFAGKVDLIYIDPPFDTGADFSFNAAIPDSEEGDPTTVTFTKEPSIIEQKAYRDTWGRGINSYIAWFYETLSVLHELLAETGSIYVHLDYHVSHYARCVLDEIFGADNFKNEVIWKRQTAHSDPKRFGPIHDTIYYYAKSKNSSFNIQYTPYEKSYIESHYSQQDEDGRRYQLDNLTARGPRPGLNYTFRGVNPPRGRVWAVLPDKMEKLFEQGRIIFTSNGTPRRKRYLDEMPGLVLQDIWNDLFAVNSQAHENTAYPTQKPNLLLERIVQSSSSENNLVLDCFCGSGTTPSVAEKLNRRWIACDLGRFAIHTTRKRLLAIPDVRPFVVQNLGKYERQAWQAGVFGSEAESAEKAAHRHRSYVEFILGLYHATPSGAYSWLHGVKGGRMVHVGGVDAPVSVGDIQQIAIEFKKAIGTGPGAPTSNGVDVLGWDFAFEVNEVAKQQAEKANIRMQFKKIPHDVMDKRAVDQGDIHFFELGALEVEVQVKGRTATLSLKNFVIHPDDVPQDVMEKVKHWSQWVDYWAVDWDHKGDTFHNEWQTFRTKKEPKLAASAIHTYDGPGEYRAVVKVIDILGNDTTKTVAVTVKK